MIILGIETSCDDTCAAIIETDYQGQIQILSNIVSSQEKIHQQWGGIVPNLARREHSKNLIFVLSQALEKAGMLMKKDRRDCVEEDEKYSLLVRNKIKKLEEILCREKDLAKKTKEFLLKYERPKIDLIAVTDQPGLEPCLWIGKNFAQALSFFWNISVNKINHLQAHISISLLKATNHDSKFQIMKSEDLFPAIGLIVSGGHTQMILMEKSNVGNQNSLPFHSKILGETKDDAAGECFDKTARILGLGYPGGPVIAEKAQQWQSAIRNLQFAIHLPRPMIYQKNYDFSFSGLKTAVLYHYQTQDKKTQKDLHYIQEMCYHIQQAIIDVLIIKTIKAAKQYQVKSIVIGGGVVANQELRKQFLAMIKKEIPRVQFLLPELKYSTDNAAMIAVQGYFQNKGKGKE
ncbi:MAG: tRNA (adenosine(37)-N6)-threonylcarbamoyltransferase complex transferase subunit TsaD [Methanosarcinales archaeon]|nr:tRNA (adenosine(37)-N6)-threonylcarbamoyltransferase complex transferase subunit TsaD [Methanosarcinales archaeon]